MSQQPHVWQSPNSGRVRLGPITRASEAAAVGPDVHVGDFDRNRPGRGTAHHPPAGPVPPTVMPVQPQPQAVQPPQPQQQ
eukprot:2628752-Prymnesium_polylepis.2